MLKLLDPRWLMFVMLFTVAALPVRTHSQTPTVVFSEIAWAGSSISSADEWIELANVSDDMIDLTGWTLTGAGSSGADLVLPDGSVVDPHSTYVIANYEHTHTNSALESAPDFVTSTLSLSNDGFSIVLYDTLGTIVDVAGGTGAPFAGRSGGAGDSDDGRYQSMVRGTGLGDGSLEESWADADTSSGFKSGIKDYGTPGTVAFATVAAEPEVNEEDAADESVEEPIVEEVVAEEPVEESTGEEVVAEEIAEEIIEDERGTILINEFVVDPNEGESEWIELANMSSESIDLTSWTIEDATGKQTALESVLEAGGYLVIESPLGILNNDTDSILLKDSTGILIDSIEYGVDELAAPKDGAALARGASGSFELTYATTPGEANMIDIVKPIVEEETEEVDVVMDESVEEQAQTDHATDDSDSATGTSSGAGESSAIGNDALTNSNSAADNISSANILINEFVVDPAGDGVEWIELYNAGDSDAILTGWSIEDALGKATDLSAITMEVGGYAVVEKPTGQLNNDGDSVILKNANGAIIQTVVYGSGAYPIPKDGEALARNAETFEITELTTPGSANLIFIAIEEVDVGAITTTPSEVEEENESQVEMNAVEEVELIKTLRFVTLYPNATGLDEEEEFMEIQNTGSEAIDLKGWSIEDGSTKRFTFEDSTILAFGETIRVDRQQTKITLNNGGDTLELIAPDGEVVDRVTYGNSPNGATYELTDGMWKWSTTATVVDYTLTATTSATTSTTNATNSTNAAYASTTASSRITQSLTIAQAKEKKDGQSVMIKGVVTATPGTFGTQIFYLQDETGGIQAYLYSGEFPALALGDVVQVTGELSTSHGERRVKLSSAAGVVPASGSFGSEPLDVVLTDLDASLVGMLMMTQGQIQSIESNKLILEHFGATLTVYLKSNPAIDTQQFQRGDSVEVTGVLTSYDGELRLRPRSIDDISVVEDASAAIATANETTEGSPLGLILLITVVSAFALLALWRYLPRRRLTRAAA